MRIAPAALILSLVFGPCAAQTGAWLGADGKPLQESEAMRSKNGFAGSLLATTDGDWRQKWDAPPEAKPEFTRAGTVPYGRQVFVLMFFANPMLDGKGQANVRCDFALKDPSGKVVLEQKDMACYNNRIAGSPYNTRLSEPVITFSGDPGDPPGEWATEAVLRDAVRGVELPLRTTFTLR